MVEDPQTGSLFKVEMESDRTQRRAVREHNECKAMMMCYEWTADREQESDMFISEVGGAISFLTCTLCNSIEGVWNPCIFLTRGRH